MAAPGVYTDEEGSIFLNDRYPDTSLRHSFPWQYEPSSTLIYPIISFSVLRYSDCPFLLIRSSARRVAILNKLSAWCLLRRNEWLHSCPRHEHDIHPPYLILHSSASLSYLHASFFGTCRQSQSPLTTSDILPWCPHSLYLLMLESIRGRECTALPVPSPSGFSVPMAPGSNLPNAYSVQSHLQAADKSRPGSKVGDMILTAMTWMKTTASAEISYDHYLAPIHQVACDDSPGTQT